MDPKSAVQNKSPTLQPMDSAAPMAVQKGKGDVRNERKPKKASANGVQENTGRWTKSEHEIFIEGLKRHGREWKLIAAMIKTRTVVQIRTHAQKYFQKVQKKQNAQLKQDAQVAGEGTVSVAKTSKPKRAPKRKNSVDGTHAAPARAPKVRRVSVPAPRNIQPVQPVKQAPRTVAQNYPSKIMCPKDVKYPSHVEHSPNGVDSLAFCFPTSSTLFSPESSATMFTGDMSQLPSIEQFFDDASCTDFDWLGSLDGVTSAPAKSMPEFAPLDFGSSSLDMPMSDIFESWDARLDSTSGSPVASVCGDELDDGSLMDTLLGL